MALPPELIGLAERPVAFFAIFARIGGSATAGLFMSQAVYWQGVANKDKDPRRDGWWFKTRKDWASETFLSRGEQESARKVWRDLGVLEEVLRGVPAKLHYRLDLYRVAECMRQLAESGQLDGGPTGRQESANQLAESAPTGGQDSANQLVEGKPTSISEITSETSSGTTSKSPRPLGAGKTTSPESGDGDSSILKPVQQGIASSLIEAYRHGSPPRDLRAVIVSQLKARGLPPNSQTIASIIAAVRGGVPTRTSSEGSLRSTADLVRSVQVGRESQKL